MVAGILVGHGRFGSGLLSALELILGEVSQLEVVSTEGRARHDIEQGIARALERFGDVPVLVFTDLRGGCATTMCSRLVRAHAGVGIICGVNLPMLIKYVQYREMLSAAELSELIVKTGLEGIGVIRTPGGTGHVPPAGDTAR